MTRGSEMNGVGNYEVALPILQITKTTKSETVDKGTTILSFLTEKKKTVVDALCLKHFTVARIR